MAQKICHRTFWGMSFPAQVLGAASHRHGLAHASQAGGTEASYETRREGLRMGGEGLRRARKQLVLMTKGDMF